MAILLDGKKLAQKLKSEILEKSVVMKSAGNTPALAVILCGDDPASAVYVRNKRKDCEECGFDSLEYKLPADYGEEKLLALVESLNQDPKVHGILVQLPLPRGYDETRIIHAISPAKDVDAFHPFNVGKIMIGEPGFLPCTPAGVMLLLEEYGIDPAGKECLVIGRSNIVGKPMAMLLLRKNGTVTIAHSKTMDLASKCREADILIAAVGKAKLIKADMIKPGAVVIDVGMNRDENGKLCGDVDFAECEKVASYITPVPGGVGPMTRAVLMKNTLQAAEESQRNL
ncbi:MAG: bifunctional methylenetetrahydrofolate dehydrogenase/methenyltetrahydrofolate cyclohydrolase FolD [Clostridia bacterium]|nr:bifunctional methylenetetrahydrofolate dehydrogenase/methenyltetrahydrofolate cyclohydrolase FolD [Clostridia bacterium]